jgi:hypothetical protein
MVVNLLMAHIDDHVRLAASAGLSAALVVRDSA